MAVQAAVTIYKQEMIAQFERRRSLLSMAPMKESMKNGLNVVWLINGSGGDAAVTRGQNGLIPYGMTANVQITGTLVEKHAAKQITGFDVFASQGNQTQALQDASYAIIRRDMDATILAEMANATQDYGTPNTVLDLDTILGAQAALGYLDVPTQEVENMFCILSPGAFTYLKKLPQFSSGDYVDVKPYNSNQGSVGSMWRWSGINFIVTNGVEGAATNAEKLFMFHRQAIGYATNAGEENIHAGYDEQQDYSWSRASIYHCAKLLQDAGIVRITHNGSAFVTS